MLLLSLAPSAFAQDDFATYYTRASCQREGTSGFYTASGAPYDESAFTFAMRSRNFGARYRICNANLPTRCQVATLTDFGPGKQQAARGVIADLTPALFDALGGRRGVNRHGVAWGQLAVTVEPLRAVEGPDHDRL